MTLVVLRLHDLEKAHKSCIHARECARVDVRHKNWSEVPEYDVVVPVIPRFELIERHPCRTV